MTSEEIDLLNLIRENDNPEQALITAIEIIISNLSNPKITIDSGMQVCYTSFD